MLSCYYFLIVIVFSHVPFLLSDTQIKINSDLKANKHDKDANNPISSQTLSYFDLGSQNSNNKRPNFEFRNSYYQLPYLSSRSAHKSPSRLSQRSSHHRSFQKILFQLSHTTFDNYKLRNTSSKSVSLRFKPRQKRPNIIFILTDDQDIELGSMHFMPKTRKILANGGAYFKNAYVTTPMCCPSRSSILTGLYTHNHNVYTNNDNCSSPQWQSTHETRTFATFLSNAGYRTAFFGKYLNEYNGSYVPPGWREWSALIKNSRFYNYSLNVNGRKVKHFDNYHLDYYPDLIINDSLAYLRQSKQKASYKPLLMVLSFPSPHGPEDAAPQYQHRFFNVTTHRTPNWNFAPNPDKQWLLRHTQKMSQLQIDFTDLLHTKRLQTLQSVDDAVERLYYELNRLGELENTYIFYTSDHGYHLGQFGLVKGKSMPFEFDIRVPFFIRGPKIEPGSVIRDIVLNIDIAPTILDIAGIAIPDYIDGKSILPLLSYFNNDESKRRKIWRDSFLIERGKINSESNDDSSNLSKKQWLEMECQKSEYSSPCLPNQKWECVYDGYSHRMKKCRSSDPAASHLKDNCLCSSSDVDTSLTKDPFFQTFNSSTHLYQMKFLKEHINGHFKPLVLHSKSRRSRDASYSFNLEGVYDLSRLLDSTFNRSMSNKPGKSVEVLQYHEKSGCFIFLNNSIVCPQQVYHDQHIWRRKKDRVDNLIKRLQLTLGKLKGIRRHLQRRRPGFGDERWRCDCEAQNSANLSRHKFHRNNRKDNIKKKERKLRRKIKFENTTCNIEKMNCFSHNEFHWKTPPLWTKKPFCFCQNSNNNTFWCLRTINETHNFLYCEFITGFISYYDLNQDPYQLNNIIFSLEWSVLKKLRKQLMKLRSCSGFRQCNSRFKSKFESTLI